MNDSGKIPFIITIDTEGDNLWEQSDEVTTVNAQYLPRFFDLCEKYGQKPTMLTNFEMSKDPFYIEFMKDKLALGNCEIGLHIHAWNSPPQLDLKLDGANKRSYLVEYQECEIHQKVGFMTKCLEDEFNVKPVSHRAGRWALSEEYVRALLRCGYLVDCSVTPGVNWSSHVGETRGGTDYSDFPSDAYYMSDVDVSQPSEEGLLQVPMTVRELDWKLITESRRSRIKRIRNLNRVVNRFFPERSWLRPNGRNLKHMIKLLNQEKKRSAPYVEFMLHSSELMPGGSPLFQTDSKIDKLYQDMEELFRYASSNFYGVTLSEYASLFKEKSR